MAVATPSVAPATAARNGGAAADATAWRGVMPTACKTWRSATFAEVYRATDWPMRKTAASSAARAKASRQAASYAVILRIGPPKKVKLSHTSISDRPVTRARSARNAGIAAAPPLSRTSALMYVSPEVPMMFARYERNRAGDASTPPFWPGPSTFTPAKTSRPTPTILAAILGPRGAPEDPSYPALTCPGLARCRVSVSPTCLPKTPRTGG